MRRDEWGRFDARAVDAMLRVLGLATIACAATDAWAGAWRVHGGELFPWRHLPGFPLYGRAMLVVEWGLGLAGGASLATGRGRRAGISGALLATVLGLSQRFSNHRALLLIVLAFVALAPPDLGDASFAARVRPNLALVRAQLLLVYGMSALNKVAQGFLDGAALASLFGWPTGLARAISFGVVAAEVAIPLALLWRPWLGVAAVVVLHGAMAWLLPHVAPFSLVMLAMALAFVAPSDRVR
jgi:hypothetical protein